MSNKRKTYTIRIWGWEVNPEDDINEVQPDHYGEYKVRSTSEDNAVWLAIERAEEDFGGKFDCTNERVMK